MRVRTTLTASVVLGAAVLTAGCTTVGPTPVPAPSTPPPATADVGAVDGCPESERLDDDTLGMAAIDYVDFVQHGGRQYLADQYLAGLDADAVERADLDEEVTRSRCSFSQYNERTGQDPGPPRNGDTGFLPPGTPIHAVRGWAPECRLAAEHGGELRVYVALDPTTETATPDPCAVG
jgi:hypothetical protein